MNRLFPILILCVSVMSGCSYPVVENPLVDPVASKPVPEIHGVYKTENPDNKKLSYLHIGPAGEKFPGGFLKIILVSQQNDAKGLDSASFVAFAERIADSYIIHIPLPDKGSLENQLEKLGNQWDVKKIGVYILLRLRKSEKGLALYLLDGDFIAEQVESKKLSGRIETDADEKTDSPQFEKRMVRITAESAEIRRYFAATPLDKIFEPDGIEYKELK